MKRATALLAVALAACSNGAGPTTTTTTTPPATSPPATTSTQPAATTVAPAEPAEPVTTTTVTTDPAAATTLATTIPAAVPPDELELVAYPVPPGSRPHDVAPAADGGVWYTAQASGELGWLDPVTGETRHVELGPGSRPHGVIIGPEGLPWVTDGGLNAIVRVQPSGELDVWTLPEERPDANLNTAAFDGQGRLWFTGQNGIHGVLDPGSGAIEVFDSPRGRGPYGIAATPLGQIYFASLAGSFVGLVAPDGSVTVLDPPTPDQGARRVWADSAGGVWVSEWNSGQLSRYAPQTDEWSSWPLPGDAPQAYAVYVDETDTVWVSDFGGNAIHRFDPGTAMFTTFPLPSTPGNVRQILGRPGEVWGAESAADQLVVIRRRG